MIDDGADDDAMSRPEMLTCLQLHGEAASAASKAGVKDIALSISHSDKQAIAVAVANF